MEEKKKEDEIEAKIRNLRKARNKAWLTNEICNPSKKRQKLDEINYISIRDHWGPPPTTAPRKNKILESDEQETN